MNIDGMVKDILEQLRQIARTETIIGEEFKIGDFSAKPVMKVGMGIGGGGAEGDKEKEGKGTAGGSGGGVKVEPIGFLVAKGNEISFVSTDNKTRNISAIFDKVPDLMDKVMQMKKEDKKDN